MDYDLETAISYYETTIELRPSYARLERAFHEKGNYKDAMEVSLYIDELCIQNEEDIQIYMLNIFHIGENACYFVDIKIRANPRDTWRKPSSQSLKTITKIPQRFKY